MYNLWAFLLQTLTASGAAVLLLIIKYLLKDKLTPSWHFFVWSVLGIVLLFPAGTNGTYSLVNWRFPIEVIKSFFGDYSYVRVLFPFPVIKSVPKTVPEWIFLLYAVGIMINLGRYTVSYIRLRCLVGNGQIPNQETLERIHILACRYDVKVDRIKEVAAVPTAFVCGFWHPVFVIPEGRELDDKVILHELVHYKNKDTLWNSLICLLRCLHWCNPILQYCAKRAMNDMESRCDQRVMEVLEGEERREYGRILLSMTNEQYANTPGCTGINNGGKNISERIEALARFKRYPAGMGLVSVCVMIILTFSLVVGVRADSVLNRWQGANSALWNLASARSTPCTTYAGAMDTYGKAVLTWNGVYRSMCAKEADQKLLEEKVKENGEQSFMGVPERRPKVESGYYIYNLKEENGSYQGLLVLELMYGPDYKKMPEGKMYLAYQTIEAKKENGRWVIEPLTEFQYMEAEGPGLTWGCLALPGVIYSDEAGGFKVEIKYQTVHRMNNEIATNDGTMNLFGVYTTFDSVPKPHAEFSEVRVSSDISLLHLGTEEERASIDQVGVSSMWLMEGESRPEYLRAASGGTHGGSSNTGESYQSLALERGWDKNLSLGGGGTSYEAGEDIPMPKAYAADFYVNNELVAAMTLYPEGGGEE